MHNFIEWDNEKKVFCVPKGGCMLDINEWFETYIGSERFSIHEYIGKIDADNKRIFANSSIVEIGFSWQESKDRIKGFFDYDKAALGYVIWDLEKNDYIDYDVTKMQYFKIIDTVQENKLGLVK